MALPQLSDQERKDALAKAAAARVERAKVKEGLKTGTLTLAEVLDDPSASVGKMRIVALLAALPGIGQVRARRTISELGISESRRVRGLGSVQRVRLLEHFAPSTAR